jgi:hypothetical protein
MKSILTNGVPSDMEWDSKQKIEIIGMSGDNLLAENMIYDSSTSQYYIIFSNYNTNPYTICLISSFTPLDSKSWHYVGTIIKGGVDPCIINDNKKWYIIYSDRDCSAPYPIVMQSANKIFGVYGDKKILVKPQSDFEKCRCDEPFVIKTFDKYIMLYMGDAGNFTEQICMATADDLNGIWTEDFNNPVIRFGDTYDKGTVADPWIFKKDNIFNIGYSCSETNAKPWRTALAITKDFKTFDKQGIILNLDDDFDKDCAFRGAISEFNNILYYPYTGRSENIYKMCMAIKRL